MLKIECPGCKQWLHSPFLAEMKETRCPTCNAVVEPKDIYISAGSFSISREVLLKHMFKYQRLLKEASKELEELKNEGKTKPYKVSQDNVRSFIDSLQEMLEGCRSGFRVAPGEKTVRYYVESAPHESTLVNISLTGVCLKAAEPSTLPRAGMPVVVEVIDEPHDFRMEGTVVWSSPKGTMGVQFKELDEGARSSLMNYIMKDEEFIRHIEKQKGKQGR